MNKNKDIFDMIDDYFSEINSEELTKKINKGVKNLSETIEESLKNSGYSYEYKETKQKPEFSKYLKNYSSRIEYVKETLHHVNYGSKYRGYYQDGHMQAIKDIEPHINKYSYNLDELSNQIKTQIREIKNRTNDYKRAYVNGYIDGLEYVQKTIRKSKNIMMERILKEI